MLCDEIIDLLQLIFKVFDMRFLIDYVVFELYYFYIDFFCCLILRYVGYYVIGKE